MKSTNENMDHFLKRLARLVFGFIMIGISKYIFLYYTYSYLGHDSFLQWSWLMLLSCVSLLVGIALVVFALETDSPIYHPVTYLVMYLLISWVLTDITTRTPDKTLGWTSIILFPVIIWTMWSKAKNDTIASKRIDV